MVIDPRLLQQAAAGQWTIHHDLPCAQCKYNLRGLKRSDLCPECGTPVDPELWAPLPGEPVAARGAVSKAPQDLLEFSWEELGRLGRATTLLAWGLVAMGAVLWVLWPAVLLRVAWGVDFPRELHTLGLGLVCLPAAVCAFVGVLALTSTRPDTGGEEHGHKPRSSYARLVREVPGWVRGLARYGSAAWPLAMALGAAASGVRPWSDWWADLFMGLSVPVLLIGACAFGALSYGLRPLTMAARDDAALNRCMMGTFGMPLALGFMALTPALLPLATIAASLASLVLFSMVLIAGLMPVYWIGGLVSLAAVCRWSRRAIVDREERDERFRARSMAQAGVSPSDLRAKV